MLHKFTYCMCMHKVLANTLSLSPAMSFLLSSRPCVTLVCQLNSLVCGCVCFVWLPGSLGSMFNMKHEPPPMKPQQSFFIFFNSYVIK